MMIRLLLTFLALSMTSYPLWAATASDYSLLGLKLATATKDDIRNGLYSWDGLEQSKATIYRKQFNRFYPKNILREAYRLDFRYEQDGHFSSLQLRYRPFAPEYNNSNKEIDTPDIVRQLIPMIGMPTRFKRMSSGLPSYNAYHWEDDKVSIMLDRENQQPGRPLILSVRMKNTALASNYIP
jgi:hypothetical protein